MAIPIFPEIPINLNKMQLQKNWGGKCIENIGSNQKKKTNHGIIVESIYSPNPCINKDFVSEESRTIS